MAKIIDGKEVAKKTREKLKKQCEELKKQGIEPKFAVILVGDNPASKVYVKNKSKVAQEVGILFEEYTLDAKIEQKELIELIQELNHRKDIHGILLQSPIPNHLDINEAFRTIAVEKDIDGFHPTNIGKLVLGQNTFISCTPYGIMKMLEEYQISLASIRTRHICFLHTLWNHENARRISNITRRKKCSNYWKKQYCGQTIMSVLLK